MDYQHLTKDRSLGYTELHVNELAAEADSEEYPCKSTGKKVEAANLKFEKAFKGQLHYEAEFIPALALRNFEFSTGGNNIQHVVNDANGDAANGDGGSISSSDIEGEAVPTGITTRGPLDMQNEEGHTKNKGSTDTSLTEDADHDTGPTTESSADGEAKSKSRKGVVLSKEELMQHRKSR